MKYLFLIFTIISLPVLSQSKNGEIKKYYSNGKLETVNNYKNGKKNGVQLRYHKNGKVKSRLYRIDGKIDGIWEMFYDNGNKSYQAKYEYGKADGIITSWYRNGIIKYKNEHKNGMKWNVLVHHDIHGNYLFPGTLKNGNGTQYLYDEYGNGIKGEGVLYAILTYKNGKYINKKTDVNKEKISLIKEVREVNYKYSVMKINIVKNRFVFNNINTNKIKFWNKSGVFEEEKSFRLRTEGDETLKSDEVLIFITKNINKFSLLKFDYEITTQFMFDRFKFNINGALHNLYISKTNNSNVKKSGFYSITVSNFSGENVQIAVIKTKKSFVEKIKNHFREIMD